MLRRRSAVPGQMKLAHMKVEECMRFQARLVSASLFLGLLFAAALLPAQSAPAAVPTPAIPDGPHDFDFEVGTWNIHLKKLLHPLTGSNDWVEFDGVSMTRRIMDGHASIEQFETDGAAGHIEGLTLRLYDPQSHEWRLYWANSKTGHIDPPQIGEFRNGRGEFYAQDIQNGRAVIIRFIWSDITPNSAHFEQSFSADGGKTWEVNWITDQTRTGPEPDWSVSQENHPTTLGVSTSASTVSDAQHDFDFNFGVWNTHIESRVHPLAGSDEFNELNGTVTVHKIWGGRASLEEIDASGAKGHLQGMTLFLYNPTSHQWSQTFASLSGGVLEESSIGRFKDGRGELFDQENLDDGQAGLVRGVWSQIAPDSHHFEISYSDDGGKTWESEFNASLTRRSH
jgi:hypothetical protein